MPKVSKETAAEAQEIGIGTISTEVVDGYEFDFFDLHEEADMSHLLKGLPDDRCTCPHWGYVTRGSVTFTFADHVETFEAGDAFHVPAGHSPATAAGTEYLLISPADQVAEVDEVIQRNLQALQST